MRTTLTLDADVAIALEHLQRERKSAFKVVVNDVLRTGLDAVARRSAGKRTIYRVKPRSLGAPRLPSLDNIAEVLALGEDESAR